MDRRPVLLAIGAVGADDLPAIVDLVSRRDRGAGDINGVKPRLSRRNPCFRSVGIDVAAHNLAAIVDADDLVDGALRRVDGGEVAAPVPEIAMAVRGR